MKIEIKKSILEQVLSQLQPFLEKKDMSQITSHIYIKTNQNRLYLKATDYEIGLKTIIDEIQIIKEGEATANGKKLLEIIRILKDDTVTLEIKENSLIITQNRSRFKLPTFDPTEYPTFPTINDLPKLDLLKDQFIPSLKKITPVIDTNNPKYELNGALIDIIDQKTNFVATDTKRLALVTFENKTNNSFSLIIPRKAIIEMQKLFFEDLSIYYDKTYFIIESGPYFFFTKLINGKFPDYERIIPKSIKYELTLPKDKIIEAIKQITIISQEIKLTFLPDKIIFKSLSEENIEAETEITIQTPFKEKFIMAINSKFLLDFLNNIQDNEFLMGINGSDLPFKLKKENFITIIMPIII